MLYTNRIPKGKGNETMRVFPAFRRGEGKQGMNSIGRIILLAVLLTIPSPARGEFQPSEYQVITQAELVKKPGAHAGKKYQVTDVFQFCGSDFCVQFLKTKINTKEYYCFTLGELCLIRMYLKKDHSDAVRLLKLKKGEGVTVFGTFDKMGTRFHFMIVDRLVTGTIE
jgi:hypothetical protein